MEYAEYRKEKMESAGVYQDFIVDLLWGHGIPIAQYTSREYQLNVGESKNGIEIKHDERLVDTGNLYI